MSYWPSIDEEEPGQQVAHHALGAEADGGTDDGGAGQQRREVDPEGAEDDEEGDGEHHDRARCSRAAR